MTPEIIHRALTSTLTDIGQLSKSEKRALNDAVARGVIVRGLGGPYPSLKWVYAHPGYDFKAWRRVWVEEDDDDDDDDKD